MAHDPGADLHELLAQGRQRPLRTSFGSASVLTVTPVMPLEGWRERYDALFADAASALAGVPGLDLTVEFITHRFSDTSKETLLGWYPSTSLDMDEGARARKLTRFGTVKHVYPAPLMRELRAGLERACARRLPAARVLYWT